MKKSKILVVLMGLTLTLTALSAPAPRPKDRLPPCFSPGLYHMAWGPTLTYPETAFCKDGYYEAGCWTGVWAFDKKSGVLTIAERAENSSGWSTYRFHLKGLEGVCPENPLQTIKLTRKGAAR